MSKPPSRSEIESALSGRIKHPHNKKGNKNNNREQPSHDARNRHENGSQKNLEFGQENAPRRQKEIGGKLSGVNKRKTFGIFSRYNKFNIANWAIGSLVIMILAAFFWPQEKITITEVNKKFDANKIIEIDDQEIENAASGKSGFARSSDKARVQKFRKEDEIDQQIKALLLQADNLLRVKQYTQPRDDNAVDLYKKVLDLRPNNSEAVNNLSKIRRHFLFRGVNALNADKLSLAKSNLERLALVDPNSSEYRDLESDIEAFKIDQQVNSLNIKAKNEFDKGNLTLPSEANSYLFYQQALELRPENDIALNGVLKIADSIAEKAKSSIINNNYDLAKTQIATLVEIRSTHQSIPLLNAMLENIKLDKNSINQKNDTQIKSTIEDIEPSTSNETSNPKQTSSPKQTSAQQADKEANVLDNETQTVQSLSTSKTPENIANEQELLDKQYLLQGLDAYYSNDFDNAKLLLQPLADKGIARAQIRLAYMHFLGRGFVRNRTEAERTVRTALAAIRKFANEGRPWAQSDLGSLYEDGLVLPKDYREAIYWYRGAAEKGYPNAQTQLANMYMRGRGVESNRNTAVVWYKRAAKQGDKIAKRNLESLGIPQP